MKSSESFFRNPFPRGRGVTEAERLLPFRDRRTPWLDGALAGNAAVTAGLLVWMLLGWATEVGFWAPLRWLAVPVWGSGALAPGVPAAFAGLVVAAVLGILLALPFASAVARSRHSRWFPWLGAVYGLFLWALDTGIALPLLSPRLDALVQNELPGAWFLAHLTYGVVLGFVAVYHARPERPAGASEAAAPRPRDRAA